MQRLDATELTWKFNVCIGTILFPKNMNSKKVVNIWKGHPCMGQWHLQNDIFHKPYLEYSNSLLPNVVARYQGLTKGLFS